jgi:hypothetical protein
MELIDNAKVRTERVAGLIFGDLSWELDFSGHIRRATEAARAEFLRLRRKSQIRHPKPW